MNGSFFINKYLEKGFDKTEAHSEIDFAINILFGYTPKDFILGKELSEEEKTKLDKIITKRVNTHKPIQQLIGMTYFAGEKFFVNEYTLVPRPETEILVDEIFKRTKNSDNLKILDIGSGTGCIPIMLALKNANLTAHSVDISDEAIKVAEENAKLHKVDGRVKFFKSNLFENINEKYNVIVSNPPYIPLKDKPDLQIEVRDFDPPEALFTEDIDGIEFYGKIISSAKNYLSNNGLLGFEIGKKQCSLVCNLLEKYNYKNIKVIKDLDNIERIIISQK